MSEINPHQIKSNLKKLESDPKAFFETCVEEDVHWTVSTPATGPQGKTTVFSGICHSKTQFLTEVLAPLNEYFSEPLKLKIIDILVDDSSEDSKIIKSCTEMVGTAKLKDGKTGWENYYSWVFHWSRDTGKVFKCRAYFDSAATNLAVSQAAGSVN